jgi:hydrogenase nickel incorporation protein HypB
MGNLTADRQISRITRHGYQGVPVTSAPFTAWHMRDVLARLTLCDLNMLFVEIEGNSLTPAEFNLGQHYRIGVFSAAGGDDKVNEFPLLVAKSDLILLTKVDLLPYVNFDPKVFTDDIARLKPHLPVIQLSVQSGRGMDVFRQWIKNRITFGPINHETPRVFEPMVKLAQK